MKIVVDTNIAFSAVLNTNGKIGDLLFNSGTLFTFYSCDYLRTELVRHKAKLLKIAKQMTEEQVGRALSLVLGQITFINEALIEESVWLTAEEMVQPIDPDDTDFVALPSLLNDTLWTGDKVLHTDLKTKEYTQVMNTDELCSLRIELTN